MTSTVQSIDEAVHRAHEAYVEGINSNDIDRYLATITDDIVYLPPGTDPIRGKADVGAWVKGYFDAVHTRWTKTTVELIVAGTVAYEWYRFASVDTPRDGGDPTTGSGNGVNIYRLDTDGTWRVARDIWADGPAAS